MKPVKFAFQTTLVEKFYFEKIIELLDNATIDSYRLRLHNPKSLLLELQLVLSDLKDYKLKNKTYADTIIEELLRMLVEENELNFKSIKKEYFIHILKLNQTDYNHIFYTVGLILKDNTNYVNAINIKIQQEVVRINNISNIDISELKLINRLIGYYIVEIKNIGYSKIYLHRFIRNICKNKHITLFFSAYKAVESLIFRPLENFKVLLKITIDSDPYKNIQIESDQLKLLSKKEATKIIKETNEEIEIFLSDLQSSTFQIDCTAPDFYSATGKVRAIIYRTLDALHMGHSNKQVVIHSKCAIIGSVQPKRSGVQNFNYVIDGYFKSHQSSYKIFLRNINSLNLDNIEKNAINRIFSGLRYLRLGTEALELENKLLNYWIGIEFMFSIYDAESHTVGRLRAYYKKCHAYIYIRRLLIDFHKSIKNFKVDSAITTYNDDLLYLNSAQNLETIIDLKAALPLLAYRAYTIKMHLEDPKIVAGTLQKHQQNLDWNLNRIYRIRNEIVHNAAINLSIELVVSHLRYYLIFILNSTIDFFINEKYDLNSDKKISIDDYFLLREVQVNNLLHNNKLLFKDLIDVSNPTDYLT